jgi:hypothetical protein
LASPKLLKIYFWVVSRNTEKFADNKPNTLNMTLSLKIALLKLRFWSYISENTSDNKEATVLNVTVTYQEQAKSEKNACSV